MTREGGLPGLATWTRVRDWRLGQLMAAPEAALYLGSRLSADDILSYGIPRVAIATGARWRIDGVGRQHRAPLTFLDHGATVSVDTIIDQGPGCLPPGPVVIFDDDRYYMASVIAERLSASGFDVTYVTPAPIVASWTVNTLEQGRIQARLIDRGVKILALSALKARDSETLTCACVYSGRETTIACASLVPVTSRLPVDDLWSELSERRAEWPDCGITRIQRIGDCLAPGVIAAAVYAGHAFARTLDQPAVGFDAFR